VEDPVGHAELLALVDVGGAAQHVQRGGQGGRRGVAARIVAEAADGARLVMVVQVEAVPANASLGFLPGAQAVGELAGTQRAGVELSRFEAEVYVVELEHHVELTPGRVRKKQDVVAAHARSFADRHGSGAPREDLAAHLGEVFMQVGPFGEVREALAPRAPGVNDAVGQGRVLRDQVDDVHAEAVDAAVEPPVHHVIDGGADLGVVPVQVGLLLVEQVQVVLARSLVPGPGRAGEEGPPVGGLRPGLAANVPGAGVTPDVPVALGIIPRGARLDEPRVFIGGMVDDQVHDEAHAAFVDVREQAVEVRERPKHRVDVVVVGDVVAVVGLRGGVDRREPQDVHAQVLQVVQLLSDAFEVPEPVAVGILEGARIDLVYDRALPPLVGAEAVARGVQRIVTEEHGAPAIR